MSKDCKKIFLAGIIQGSLPDSITEQSYRQPLVKALQKAFPVADIYDPVAEFPDSLNFAEEKAGEVFFHLMRSAGEADLLVAYIPSASMGTAIEIWQAYNCGKPIVAISPLGLNWVLRFCVNHVCQNIDEFCEFAASGTLAQLVSGKTSLRKYHV